MRAATFVAKDYFTIRRRILLGDNLDGDKMRREPGARQLVGLLGVVALGHQDEMMTRGQFGQRLRHAGQQLYLLLGDGARESANALALFLGHRRGAEALEAVDKRAREAGRP